MQLLDIDCGWGGLARYAARHYGCRVVGITISREQQRYAEQFCRGLDVEIRLQDYREIRDQFDRVVSVGMIEHVGYRNYRAYMRAVFRSLGAGGLFVCQGIAANLPGFALDPWMRRYIFPTPSCHRSAAWTARPKVCSLSREWKTMGRITIAPFCLGRRTCGVPGHISEAF